jgi:hypothetical protein
MDIRAIPKRIEEKVDQWKDAPPAWLPGARVAKGRTLDPELQLHMLATYRLLRLGMGWFAIAYPFALVGLGLLFFGVNWQPSISDYYYALPRGLVFPQVCAEVKPAAECSIYAPTAAEMSFPLRSFFCGGLISIGVFLILYKGIKWLEEWALNFAGLFAIGVAVFPMNKTPFSSGWTSLAHFTSATFLYLCMWFVVGFCAKDTFKRLPKGSPKIEKYQQIYLWLSRAMLGVLALGAVYVGVIHFFTSKWLDQHIPLALFWIEALGVVVFGSYWVIKSREIANHRFETQHK